MEKLTNVFYPSDKFSQDMLSSIPIKIKAWLENMNKETVGEFDDVKWSFDPDGGMIIFGRGGDNLIQIWWTGEKYTASGNMPQFENIGKNLDFFVEVEKNIYAEFVRLHEMEEAAVAIRISYPSKSVPT